MKNVFKNILLVFVIIYTVISIIIFFMSEIELLQIIREVKESINVMTIEKYQKIEEDTKNLVGIDRELYEDFDDSFQRNALLIYSSRLGGQTDILNRQISVLGMSLILSIIIGSIISYFKKESKKV